MKKPQLNLDAQQEAEAREKFTQAIAKLRTIDNIVQEKAGIESDYPGDHIFEMTYKFKEFDFDVRLAAEEGQECRTLFVLTGVRKLPTGLFEGFSAIDDIIIEITRLFHYMIEKGKYSSTLEELNLREAYHDCLTVCLGSLIKIVHAMIMRRFGDILYVIDKHTDFYLNGEAVKEKGETK